MRALQVIGVVALCRLAGVDAGGAAGYASSGGSRYGHAGASGYGYGGSLAAYSHGTPAYASGPLGKLSSPLVSTSYTTVTRTHPPAPVLAAAAEPAYAAGYDVEGSAAAAAGHGYHLATGGPGYGHAAAPAYAAATLTAPTVAKLAVAAPAGAPAYYDAASVGTARGVYAAAPVGRLVGRPVAVGSGYGYAPVVAAVGGPAPYDGKFAVVSGGSSYGGAPAYVAPVAVASSYAAPSTPAAAPIVAKNSLYGGAAVVHGEPLYVVSNPNVAAYGAGPLRGGYGPGHAGSSATLAKLMAHAAPVYGFGYDKHHYY